MLFEIIVKHWLNFLLTAISGGLTLLCKKFWNLYQAEKQRQKSEEQQAFHKALKDAVKESVAESKRDDKILQDQIDILKSGILSIQRREFKQECRELLKDEHKITLAEFETIQEEHATYHALGGNGSGDALYNMVEKKAENTLSEK